MPYTLAVFHSRSLSSSTENNQTLMKQVTANKEKLSRLEQEKEQLVVDLQLLSIKYEKEQKVGYSIIHTYCRYPQYKCTGRELASYNGGVKLLPNVACVLYVENLKYSRRQKKVSVHYLRYVISTIKVRLHSTELVRSCKTYLHRGSTALSAHFQRTLIRTFTVLHTRSLR